MPRITRERLSHALLVWVGFSAALSSLPVVLAVRESRVAHWLNYDGGEITATVTEVHRPLVKYSYRVGAREYAGKVKMSPVPEVGDKLAVFVSASHPWISSLGRPPIKTAHWPATASCCLGLSLLVMVPIAVSLRKEDESAA